MIRISIFWSGDEKDGIGVVAMLTASDKVVLGSLKRSDWCAYAKAHSQNSGV